MADLAAPASIQGDSHPPGRCFDFVANVETNIRKGGLAADGKWADQQTTSVANFRRQLKTSGVSIVQTSRHRCPQHSGCFGSERLIDCPNPIGMPTRSNPDHSLGRDSQSDCRRWIELVGSTDDDQRSASLRRFQLCGCGNQRQRRGAAPVCLGDPFGNRARWQTATRQ